MIKVFIGKKILNWFIHDNMRDLGFNIKCKLDTDFAYLPHKDIVCYSLTMPSDSTDAYMEFCHKKGLSEDISPFMISLFHELGHRETWDELTDKQLESSKEKKDKLFALETYTKKDYFDYFKCPDELKATKWAIDFLNVHHKSILEVQNNIERGIKKFYKFTKVDETEI